MGMYDQYGCSRITHGVLDWAWDWGNNFAGVVAVAPIVGASLVQPYDYVYYIRRY